MSSIESRLSRTEITTHPAYIEAVGHIEAGHFNTPEGGAVFWSNNQQEGPDGRLIPQGRITANNFVKMSNDELIAKGEPPHFRTMESLEKAHGIRTLDDIWSDPSIPSELRDEIGKITSEAYAIGASGNVTISAKNTDTISFFRASELNNLMNNPAIISMTTIEQAPDGSFIKETLPKRESYHKQRDQWLSARIDTYEQSLLSKDTNPEQFEFAKKSVCSEIVHTQFIAKNRYPFSNGEISKQNAHTEYTAEDQAKESLRLERCNEMMRKYPDIKAGVDKHNLDATIAISSSILPSAVSGLPSKVLSEIHDIRNVMQTYGPKHGALPSDSSSDHSFTQRNSGLSL